jgi:hypothetical protein
VASSTDQAKTPQSIAGAIMSMSETERELSIRYPFLALFVFAAALTLLIAIRSLLPDDTFRDLQWLLAIALIAASPLLIPFLRRSGVTRLKTPLLEADLQEAVEESRLEVSDALRLETISIEVNLAEVEVLTQPEVLTRPDLLSTTPGYQAIEWIRKVEADRAEVIPIDLGRGDRWWLSRLYLLAFLIEDFTFVRLLVFTETRAGVERYFLGCSEPRAVRRALESTHPEFAEARLKTSRDLDAVPDTFLSLLANEQVGYVESMNLQSILGPALSRENLETHGRALTLEDYRLLVNSPERYVVITNHGKFETVVDQNRLALAIAQAMI